MADGVKQILAKPIQLADQVAKLADDAHSFKQECAELKSKSEKLAALLRQAARAADLYERPTRRIVDDTEQVLDKALALVAKCRNHGVVKRVFTIIPAAAFKKMAALLENSIGDVSWLLRVSSANRDDDGDEQLLGLPPIASTEPILSFIWEQIAKLHTGSIDERSDAAASLVSLAKDNERNDKLIIEEGGVVPLLKLVKEGRVEGQENAARAIGLLGRDADCVEQLLHAGVCTVFTKVLKEGPMKVQAMVAWAVAELAANYPKCQDLFAQNNVIRLLVGHLAFETVQEHSKYTITSKGMPSIHSVVLANNNTNNHQNFALPTTSTADNSEQSLIRHPNGNQNPGNKTRMHAVVQSTMAAKSAKLQSSPMTPIHHHHHSSSNGSLNGVSLSGASIKGRELEDPDTKAHMKAMAAKALWHLAKGNSAICKNITESRALLCFAVLLEKGTDEVQLNSAMALMEIALVAEQDADLRRSAFKPNSPSAKAVIDQILRIVEKADYSDLLVPCIIALGCLSRTFRATETRIIAPLVGLLEEREVVISKEAVIALTKFACTDNYLHVDHSKAIINAGGAKHLIQLVYFGEQAVKIASLVLLCYIALHVPDSESLAQDEVLKVLEWASKQGYMVQDPSVDSLLPEAKSRLELYQSRVPRGYH